MCPQKLPSFKLGWGRSIATALRSKPGNLVKAILIGAKRVNRASCTRLLVERLTDEVVVSNLGQATLDLQNIGDRPLNCYTFGSMGQCSSIGLGIVLARP